MNTELIYFSIKITDSQDFYVPDKPRREAGADFRLFTGHDCLAAHLYLIGILTEAVCFLCDKRSEPMDKYHLRTCGALHGNTESSRYWEARGFMGRYRPIKPSKEP
ncbi:reverse transcriptase domain-containing protein [Nephila pilipes]|uniref:Reverse transcriptase domain-containing protein n=1 Tax=Nephila pilipes TaxID=299642 RepID=A0A8X6PEZ6_NEPPI|nr:reverse transcriptase domain-containing protein [Nephila pilipes]